MQDNLYWIPHELHGYIPGLFLQEAYGGSSLVETIDGEVYILLFTFLVKR